MELIFHLLFSFLATVTFGIITNIPRKALVGGLWHYWHDRLDDLLCLNANF